MTFPTGIAILDRVPGISQNLLQAETQTARCLIHLQDDGLDALALLQDVAGTLDAFGPRHFRDVDQSFDAGQHFDKSAEIRQPGDFAGDAIAGIQLRNRFFPRIGRHLLQAERNLSGLLVDLQDLQVEHIADRQFGRGIGHARPGNVADVQAGRRRRRCRRTRRNWRETARCRARRRLLPGSRACSAGPAGFFFHHRAAIDDDVFVIDVELDDAASNFLADQLFHFRGIADAAARSRQERARSDIDGEAALHHAGDAAGHDFLVFERAGQSVPIARPRPDNARQRRHAFAVEAGDRHIKGVAALDAEIAVGDHADRRPE